MSSKPSSAHPVPLVYRVVFHYIEPLFATGGIIQVSTAPKAYLDIAAPSLSATLDQAGSLSTEAMRTLYTQILGGWCMIVFNDLVTLRIFEHDLKVWRCILASHLISDILYTWAIFQDWGSKTWAYQSWDTFEWFTIVTTVVPMLLKVAFVLGIGISRRSGDKVKVNTKRL